MSKGKRKTFQRHFRKIRDSKHTGHPAYVYDEEGNKYKVIGITSSPKTNGKDNIMLEVNPEPGNKKTAYAKPYPDKADKGACTARLKNWKVARQDKKKIDIIIQKDNRDSKKDK